MTIRIAMLDDSKPFRIKFPYTKRRESVWHFKQEKMSLGANNSKEIMYHTLIGLRSRHPHKWTRCDVYGSTNDEIYRLKYIKKHVSKAAQQSFKLISESQYIPF